MIITKQKDLNTVLNLLGDKRKVFLVGCGECATTCKTGGEEQIAEIKGKLESAGKTITGWAIPDAPCVSAQIKTAMAKNRKALGESDAIVVYACGSGTQSVKENDRLNLDVFSGNDTICAATVDSEGNFKEVCSSCGDCLLDLTEGICPVTRCAKGLMNGPCGGQKDGKCEVDREKDCAWILIYKKKTEKNRVADLSNVIVARDHKKSLRPHQIPGGKC